MPVRESERGRDEKRINPQAKIDPSFESKTSNDHLWLWIALSFLGENLKMGLERQGGPKRCEWLDC